jgi:hypothetical protein
MINLRTKLLFWKENIDIGISVFEHEEFSDRDNQNKGVLFKSFDIAFKKSESIIKGIEKMFLRNLGISDSYFFYFENNFIFINWNNHSNMFFLILFLRLIFQ